MAHIPHSQIDYVEETLLSYPEVCTYLIGMETTDFEHMHFVVTTTKQTWYRNFSKRVFIDKFKLRGKAVKGKPRQYGMIGKIKDEYKLKCYTVKDKNIRTNMPQSEIDDYVANSRKKVELEGYYSQILAKIDDFVKNRNSDYLQSQKEISKNYIDTHEKNKNLERSNRRQYDDLPEDVKIFIIKEFQDSKIDSITKGKIDAVWNRWMTKNCDPAQIYYYIYRKRA